MKRTLLFITLLSLLGCATPPLEMSSMPMEHDMNMDAKMIVHGEMNNSLEVMDFNIAFERPPAETGKTAPLKFNLSRQGEPLTELQIMHDKPMHVILVRKDLKHFDHVHPEQPEPGIFVVPYIFAASGEYRIWTDFMYGNMQHIIDFDINVTGEPEAKEPDKLNGLHVAINQPEQITEGKAAPFTFTITDETGKAVPITEKFLAAAGHLILIDETLNEFSHAHDEKMDNDNVLSFEYTPENPGKHKAWVQFSVDGQNRTAAFEFAVRKA